MLVLTRKPNQQLHIGNDIVITVVKVRGNTIRLGIEAPKDVRVIRSELEPKPAASGTSASHSVAASDSQSPASAAESDAQPEAETTPSDIDGVMVDAPLVALARVSIESQPKPSGAAAPLKRFPGVKRSPGAKADRNLEDCPLCHHASHDLAPSQRSGGLHSYIAAKSRDKQAKSGRVVSMPS